MILKPIYTRKKTALNRLTDRLTDKEGNEREKETDYMFVTDSRLIKAMALLREKRQID